MTDIMRARATRFVHHIPRIPGQPINWIGALEWMLLAVLALQIARLFWAVVTPIDSYGAWTRRQAVIPSAAEQQAIFTRFDPFFRTSDGTSASPVVTSLALTVYGIRVNEGSGQGSAIIATPDGLQSSFVVGDAILPGVTLKAVAFDHIVIDRGGAEESLFLDQSQPAPVADPGAPAPALAAPEGLTVSAIKSDIAFSPRTESGRVTGIVLSPKGPAFQGAGFRLGDIVTQINGRPVGSMSDIQTLQRQLVPGAHLSLMVERGATTVPIDLMLRGA